MTSAFKAQNGNIYCWWEVGYNRTEWVHWSLSRCLSMAKQYRQSSRSPDTGPTAKFFCDMARRYRRDLLTAMLEAREQRKPITMNKAA